MDADILKWIRGVVLHTIRTKSYYGLDPMDIEDLNSIAYMAYERCRQRYDASKGASLKTYAGHRIRGIVADEMKKTITFRSNHLNEIIPNIVVEPKEGKLSTVSLSQFISSIEMDSRDREILRMHLFEDKNNLEIGRVFGFSESMTSKILHRIFRDITPQVIDYVDGEY